MPWRLLGGAAAARPGAAALTARSLVAAVAGALMALIHAFLVDHAAREPDRLGARADDLRARRLSSYLANDLELANAPAEHHFTSFLPQGLRDAPVVGPILFDQNALVYASWAAWSLVAWYLARTRPGLTCARSASRPRPPTRWAST